MNLILTLSVIFVFALLAYAHNTFADSGTQTKSDVRLSGALLDKPFDLRLNETTLITSDNIRIKLLNITSDSRCPSDVTCIWQGVVHVDVSAKKDGIDYGGIGLELGNDSNAEIPIFDKYFIQLLKVEPYPKSTHRIQPSEYVATFVVKKTKIELLLSPLQQFKSGIPIDQIQCKEGFARVVKLNNNIPICVKSGTIPKLVKLGVISNQFDTTNNSGLVVPRGDLLAQNDTHREITILSISPQNVTLPEHKNQTSKSSCTHGACFTPE